MQTAIVTKWTIDNAHSDLGFKVKHLMISTVKGSFKTFNGTVETENETEFIDAAISFEADINSIDTGNHQRDEHLKAADFFDASSYPKLLFSSTSLKPSGGGYEFKGNLTIKNITQPVLLRAEFGGITKDAWGNTKAGFEITGKINRKDFGLTWHQLTESGGIILGEDVNISADIQLLLQK
jgi:polyisoprenoid-binding protein YceI